MKKLISIVFFVAAVIRIWFDWQLTIAVAEKFRFTKIDEAWARIHLDSLQAVQPAAEQYVGLWLWEWILSPALLAPLAPVLLLLAAIFWWWGRKKRRKSMFY